MKGKWIHELRNELGLSQRKLAKKIKMDPIVKTVLISFMSFVIS